MVNIRLFGVRKALMLLGAGWVMAPAAAAAQGLEDQIRSITGTGLRVHLGHSHGGGPGQFNGFHHRAESRRQRQCRRRTE